MRLRLTALPFIVALAACGDSGATDPGAGTEMSVGDQVAIESAMEKLADTLERRGLTRQDTLLAGLTRIMGRLARLNGREGIIAVTAPGGAPIQMKAVALFSEDGATQGAAPNLNVIVAWEGLDNGAMTFRRALIVGVDDAAPEGTFSVVATSATDAARFVDFSVGAPAHVYVNVSGTMTVSGHSFTGSCPGLPSTGPFSCRAGRESASANLTVSRDDGATTPALSWPVSTIPTYFVSVD